MNLPMFSMLSFALTAALVMASDAPTQQSIRRLPTTAHPRAALTPAGVLAAAGKPTPKPPPPPVKLDIESPKYRPDLPLGVLYVSGWPLVIRAEGPPTALGIAADATPQRFPGLGQKGYLVIADPDNCLELPPPFFRGDPPCSTDPSDETYVEFGPDVDNAGVPDNGDNANHALYAALADPTQSGGPHFIADGDSDNDGVLDPVDVTVGPDTGGGTSDGYGFGADDNFPGLVLLSPTGPGLVLNSDFTRPAVRRQRNLAGFLNVVAYELNDPNRETTFTLSMVVPVGLIAPILRIDDCVGAFVDFRCVDPPRYQVDGGSVTTAPSLTNAQFFYPALVNTTPAFEVRAFLVNGVAPSVLEDLNHDGQVTAADAKLAGYNVISNEEVVRFRQYSSDICAGVPLVNVFYTDFDGNGRDTAEFVCPAGPGQITKPPQ
jgi:hypothetical protein